MKNRMAPLFVVLIAIGCSGQPAGTPPVAQKHLVPTFPDIDSPPVKRRTPAELKPPEATLPMAATANESPTTESSVKRPASPVIADNDKPGNEKPDNNTATNPAADSPVESKAEAEPLETQVASGITPENETKYEGDPIDLTGYYQTSMESLAKSERYPWRDAPRGKQVLGNIPLEIGGIFCTWGSMNAERGLVYPEQVEGIAVGRKFDALYLYHATFFTAAEGTPVSKLIFKYEDGDYAEVEICFGDHARDWYQSAEGPEELTDPKSKMVWSGVNSVRQTDPPGKIQFFITEIANPEPKVAVKSISLQSMKSPSASCIMAMTTGRADLLKVEEKKEETKESETR